MGHWNIVTLLGNQNHFRFLKSFTFCRFLCVTQMPGGHFTFRSWIHLIQLLGSKRIFLLPNGTRFAVNVNPKKYMLHPTGAVCNFKHQKIGSKAPFGLTMWMIKTISATDELLVYCLECLLVLCLHWSWQKIRHHCPQKNIPPLSIPTRFQAKHHALQALWAECCSANRTPDCFWQLHWKNVGGLVKGCSW